MCSREVVRGNWFFAKMVLKGKEVVGGVALAVVTRQAVKRPETPQGMTNQVILSTKVRVPI